MTGRINKLLCSSTSVAATLWEEALWVSVKYGADWERAGGSAWGKGGARGDMGHTAASQPHHPGAPGCNQRLPAGSGGGSALQQEPGQVSGCSACLPAQNNSPYSPLDDLGFAHGPILLKVLLVTQDGNRAPHLKTLHGAQLNHTILCDSEF